MIPQSLYKLRRIVFLPSENNRGNSWLRRVGSDHRYQGQSLMYYRYTTAAYDGRWWGGVSHIAHIADRSPFYPQRPMVAGAGLEPA